MSQPLGVGCSALSPDIPQGYYMHNAVRYSMQLGVTGLTRQTCADLKPTYPFAAFLNDPHTTDLLVVCPTTSHDHLLPQTPNVTHAMLSTDCTKEMINSNDQHCSSTKAASTCNVTATSSANVCHSSPNSDASKITTSLHNPRKEFHCHRIVLAAHSPALAALVFNAMKEGTTQTVTFPEMDPEVCELFLRYLYGCPVRVAVSQLITLLAVADQYDLTPLHESCTAAIVHASRHSPQTALQLYNQAKVHGCSRTRELCMQLLVRHMGVIVEAELHVHLEYHDLIQCGCLLQQQQAEQLAGMSQCSSLRPSCSPQSSFTALQQHQHVCVVYS